MIPKIANSDIYINEKTNRLSQYIQIIFNIYNSYKIHNKQGVLKDENYKNKFRIVYVVVSQFSYLCLLGI